MSRGSPCRAGVAAVDITPDFPVELIGATRADSRSVGVLHPLFAHVLVLTSDDERCCLVTIDSLGWTVELSDRLRCLLAEQLAVDPSRVMINYSHTHSAPAPLSPLGGRQYVALLSERLVAAVREAAGSLRPCVAGWSVGVTDIAENRRAGCTVVDDRLGALLLADCGGSPIALIVRASVHANVLMTGPALISADLLGLARRRIEHDRGCPVLFMQGAAGNLKPRGVDAIVGGTLADAERLATQLAASVRALQFATGPITRLEMCAAGIDFTCEVPSASAAQRIADQARAFGVDGSAWLVECERLRAAGVRRQTRHRQLQSFAINEGMMLGLPDELFCEIALDLWRRAGSPLVFVNGYTNGCTGYLPHAAEWGSGYEGLYSYLTFFGFHRQVMPFRRETAARIVELATRLAGGSRPELAP